MTSSNLNIRIGTGFDVHALCDNRDLVIGGITIPYHKGLEGHSDADVLVHAIMDALLGAANLGDIGDLFPDTDECFKDANSINLLKKVGEKPEIEGYELINIDSVIIAEKPKMAPHKRKMSENIARALKVNPERIGIKATTTEKLGFTGRGEGIAASAVALLEKN